MGSGPKRPAKHDQSVRSMFRETGVSADGLPGVEGIGGAGPNEECNSFTTELVSLNETLAATIAVDTILGLDRLLNEVMIIFGGRELGRLRPDDARRVIKCLEADVMYTPLWKGNGRIYLRRE